MNNFRIEELKPVTEVAGRVMGVCPVLIFNDKEAVLVDTAYPGQYELLKAEIEKFTSLDKLKTIIITHHDIDHIGNLKKFKEEFGDKITVMSTKLEEKHISGEVLPLKLAKMQALADASKLDDTTTGFYHMLKEGFPKLYTPVDRNFEMGEILNIITEIEVIGTPGHTLGHVCLYVPKAKALITGDALSLENGKVIPINEFYNHDSAEAIKSLEKLKAYDIEKTFCYHGGLYEGKLDINEVLSK